MGLIYRTTNLIYGRMYIGKQVDENKKSYLGSGKLLKQAINRYGKNNFIKEVLISGVDNRKELNEIECYLIDYYCAIVMPIYYNIADGGHGGRTESGPWTIERYNKVYTPEFRIRRGDQTRGKYNNILSSKPVLQYDLENNFIAEYPSIAEAIRQLGLDFTLQSNIGRACRKNSTARGFRWKYK